MRATLSKTSIVQAHRLVVEALTARGKSHRMVDELDMPEGPAAKATTVPFLQKSIPEHKVWSVVLEPNVDDADGHSVDEVEIEKAAHRFLAVCKSYESFDVHHKRAPIPVVPVESYIAPTDFQMGDTMVRKGSWVLAFQVHDPEIWKAIEDGELTGVSIEALARFSEDAEA